MLRAQILKHGMSPKKGVQPTLLGGEYVFVSSTGMSMVLSTWIITPIDVGCKL